MVVGNNLVFKWEKKNTLLFQKELFSSGLLQVKLIPGANCENQWDKKHTSMQETSHTWSQHLSVPSLEINSALLLRSKSHDTTVSQHKKKNKTRKQKQRKKPTPQQQFCFLEWQVFSKEAERSGFLEHWHVIAIIYPVRYFFFLNSRKSSWVK